jgi:hypothetical protein
MERVYGASVRFSGDIALVYTEPRVGLEMAHKNWDRSGSVRNFHDSLLEHFARYEAPPARDRPCGPQEVETILCKWKSHMNGHYEVGKDIREVRHALLNWGATADRILNHIPQEVQ